MIKVTVKLINGYDSKYEEVVITKEEILQFACNKAKGQYEMNTWDIITAEDEIVITANF